VFAIVLFWNEKRLEVKKLGGMSEKRELFYVKAMIFTRIIIVYVASLVLIALLILRYMLNHYQMISSTPNWAIGLDYRDSRLNLD
jgi:hypothetical protein